VGYLIGTDEAGYGPNLGPLVISATVWQVPPGVRPGDLYECLASVVSPRPLKGDEARNGRLVLADSKVLYRPGEGLRGLERGVWAALCQLDQWPESWSDVWQAMAPDATRAMALLPWYAEYDTRVPVDGNRRELRKLGEAFDRGLASADVWLTDMVSRAVFPAEFNDLVERYESKGAALSHLTLDLITRVMEPLGEGPISIVCDKHGGRDHYAPLLSEHFPDRVIEIRGEGREQSVYRFGPHERRVDVRFCVGAESYLPVALASMASKYLRELAMLAFNEYWCDRVAGLAPTAGYPQDAKRFMEAIAPMQRELGIDDRFVWRNK
jgi:ribonuclease HII